MAPWHPGFKLGYNPSMLALIFTLWLSVSPIAGLPDVALMIEIPLPGISLPWVPPCAAPAYQLQLETNPQAFCELP